MTLRESVPMTTQIHDSVEGFDVLRAEWNPLVRRSPTDTIFLMWEWQFHWWVSYRPGELRIVTVRGADGALIGIAPLFMTRQTRPSACCAPSAAST